MGGGNSRSLFSFPGSPVRQHTALMKLPRMITTALTLAAPVFAHGGHVHATVIGNIVTTATVTGTEGNKFVTFPGWGALPGEGGIGPLNGDLAVVKSGERSSRLCLIIRTRVNGRSIPCLPISCETVVFPLPMESSGGLWDKFTFLNTAR